jgi:hypothetical protein
MKGEEKMCNVPDNNDASWELNAPTWFIMWQGNHFHTLDKKVTAVCANSKTNRALIILTLAAVIGAALANQLFL